MISIFSKLRATGSRVFLTSSTRSLTDTVLLRCDRKTKPKVCEAAEDLFQDLKSGMNVFVQGMAATPTFLTTALTKHAKDANLTNISVYHMHTDGVAPYAEKDAQAHFRTKSFFLGSNLRAATAEGRADYIPVFLSETPLLFRNGIIPLDVVLVNVSPPDSHGYCSLGTSIDCTLAAMQCSKIRIAQINKNMPRTHGDGMIHISNLDYIIYHDTPLHSVDMSLPSPEEVLIGKHVAENLVQDQATLQLGIGRIPNAVLQGLSGHKDLGVHSEMFSDGVMGLIESGIITGRYKTLDTGKLISTFLTGSQKLYDFIDDNQLLEMRDVQYTNNPIIISQHHRMTSINSCIEVDLTGQVVSDSIGTKIFSGVGGQVDFLRGAAIAPGGRSILTMPSRTHKGIPRIVPILHEGGGVVTTRAHVHYIVTEYGIAYLYGKTLGERALALINIAHPDDRPALYDAAKKRLIIT